MKRIDEDTAGDVIYMDFCKAFAKIPPGRLVSKEVRLVKFADDIKTRGVVGCEEGYPRAQRDVDQMGQWAEEWQMEFNLDKCEVLHFGK
eukprot:g15548.t1